MLNRVTILWISFLQDEINSVSNDWLCLYCNIRNFRKIQDWILNPKESEDGFCISFPNRSIQDFLDHGEESTSRMDSSFFDAPWSNRSWIDLFSKETQNPFSDSFDLRIQSLIFLKKRTLKSPSQNEYSVNFSFLVKSVVETSVQKIKVSLYLLSLITDLSISIQF